MIRRFLPDSIFTFDPWKKDEVHPDHRAVGICTLDAIAVARNRMSYPEQLQNGGTIPQVKQIYYFATDRPNFWVDTTSTIEKQLEALRCHTSQVRNSGPEALIRRRAMIAGTEHKFQYAEMFHRHAM